MLRAAPALALLLTTLAGLPGCGDDPGGTTATAYFALDGELAGTPTYWDLPFPSDLRLDASGAPALDAYPNPRGVPILTSLLTTARARRGWPTMPIVYVRFTAPVPARAITDLIPAGDAAVSLVDIDPTSPERGTAFPLVAATLAPDGFVPSDLVAFAPRPGVVLRAGTRYALVVRSAFAPGFAPAPAFADLAAGRATGARAAAATALYEPLWPALAAASIPVEDVLVATVFTTGDEVGRVRARSEAVRAQTDVTITGLTLIDGATHDGFCELHGTVTMPQFQVGAAPFSTEGAFVLDGNDAPIAQSMLTIPVAITLPRAAMPAAGWPLYQFFHGSGGLSTGIVNLGRQPSIDAEPEAGKGPGYVVALRGIAAASAALPVNPERVIGATDYAYININNLAAFPYTFQQGVIEQRLFLDALLALEIPAATVAACGLPAPVGGSHHFDATKLVAGGQSMGGMYTNMIGAVEGRHGALVPTGAGGFWNLMILEAELIPGARALLGTALGIDDAQLTFVHPGMNVLAMGWEIADPLPYMARINRRPLPGLTPRHIYQPVPKDDENFTTAIYDAAALAWGNQQAGDVVWGSLQDTLALDGLDGLAPYPVSANQDGQTRVVVQFEGDGIVDPHYIYRQLDGVKHQYACFFASYLRDGAPTIPAPGLVTDPCP